MCCCVYKDEEIKVLNPEYKEWKKARKKDEQKLLAVVSIWKRSSLYSWHCWRYYSLLVFVCIHCLPVLSRETMFPVPPLVICMASKKVVFSSRNYRNLWNYCLCWVFDCWWARNIEQTQTRMEVWQRVLYHGSALCSWTMNRIFCLFVCFRTDKLWFREFWTFFPPATCPWWWGRLPPRHRARAARIWRDNEHWFVPPGIH